MPKAPTAAVLVIGDEILSGRTKDKNIGFIADTLTDIGIDLMEVAHRRRPRRRRSWRRSGRFRGATISSSPAAASARPTTTSPPIRVAKAFGVPIDVDQRAVDLLHAVLEGARHRAEREPAAHGAHPRGRDADPELRLRRSGLRDQQRLRHGRRAGDHAGDDGRGGEDAAGVRAGAVAKPSRRGAGRGISPSRRATVQKAYPGVRIGSYPYHDGQRFTTRLVLRSRDPEALAAAKAAMEAALAAHLPLSLAMARRRA